MVDLDQEIQETKKKLKKTPVNKATERERARLKSKIAKLEEKKEQKGEGKGGGKGYSVSKKGDATVSLVGLPSTGKSTLLNKLTNAESEVGSYEFTTLEVIQGMMEFRGAKIQILDVPGLIGGASKGKGRGKEVLSVIRNSDLIIILTDEERLEGVKKIENELYKTGIRLNQEEPDVKIKKKASGGIKIGSTVDPGVDKETIKEVLREKGFLNCKIVIREELNVEKLIDSIMENRVYLPGIKVLNKIDSLDEKRFKELRREKSDFIFISATEEENLKELREKIWEKLGLMRVYLKEKGEEADKEEPLILEKGSNIREACKEIHKDFKEKLSYARIWGPTAKFPGQKVGGDHVLKDEDILELNLD